MNIPLSEYGRLLLKYFRPQKGRVALMALLMFCNIGLLLVNPQIIRYFIDSAQNGSPLSTLFWSAGAFMAITFLQQAVLLAATYVSEHVGWTATNMLRADLALHCLKLDLSFHKTHTPGELIERVDGDVNQLAKFFSQLVIQLFGNLLIFVGVIVVLWWEGWQVGLSIGVMAIGGLFVLNKLRQRITPRWEDLREKEASLFGFLEERLNGTEDILTNGAKPYVMQRLYRLMRERYVSARHAMNLNVFVITFPIQLFGILYAIAHLVGGVMFQNGTMTIGDVYLLFYYLSSVLEGPLWGIIEQIDQLQKAGAGINRIAQLLQYQPTIHDGAGVQFPSGPLAAKFDEVSFHYEDDDENVITDLSFQMEPGTVLGLLGRTGSGKSTLTKLLFRFYDPTSGAIQLGAKGEHLFDIKEATQTQLRSHIGMVTQEVQLFHASLRDNLTLFDNSVNDEHILQILQEVGLGEWFESLPNGLETHVGGNSNNGLSAGQAQLLAFTRVFLADPGLVILDEASSRLDPVTEQHIERALDKLLANRTGIIVAHRLATVQRADQIMILEKGQIREYGDRTDLAANPDSRFSELLQTGLEEAFV